MACPYCTASIEIGAAGGSGRPDWSEARPVPVTQVAHAVSNAHSVPPATVDRRAKPTVFISHSTRDRDVVEKNVVQFLEDNGVDTWFSKDDIQSADDWQRKIIEGLKSCEWFLVVMSSNSANSEWVKDELHWAIERRHGKIIPVIIEDCDPLDFHIRMARIQFVDFREDSGEAQRRLLELLTP